MEKDKLAYTMKASENSQTKKITRKEAIKKAGLTALTAASVLFLSTKQSAAQSLPSGPGSNW